MTNNDIKHIESTQLNGYLGTLTYRDTVEFASCDVKAAGVWLQTFFNWKCMACRIPEHAKKVIEYEAGEHIFDDIAPGEQEPQP